MKKYVDQDTGFTVKTTKSKIIIEAPLSNLIRGFENNPNNCWEEEVVVTINRKRKQEFLEWLADTICDETESGTGDNFMAEMFGNLFQRIYEGYEDFAIYSGIEEEIERLENGN